MILCAIKYSYLLTYLTPRKASTKNSVSTFGCFGRLQSLIALKVP